MVSVWYCPKNSCSDGSQELSRIMECQTCYKILNFILQTFFLLPHSNWINIDTVLVFLSIDGAQVFPLLWHLGHSSFHHLQFSHPATVQAKNVGVNHFCCLWIQRCLCFSFSNSSQPLERLHAGGVYCHRSGWLLVCLYPEPLLEGAHEEDDERPRGASQSWAVSPWPSRKVSSLRVPSWSIQLVIFPAKLFLI